MTETKGIWIEAENMDGQKHSEKNLPSIAEAQYRLRRRYSLTPGLKRVTIFRGTNVLASYEANKKGFINVGKFSTFAQEHGTRFADATVKETLVAFDVPFTITAAIEEQTQFKDEKTGDPVYQINYDIEIDTNSPKYQYAEKVKQLGSSYRMGLPSNGYRRTELKDLINPMLESGERVYVVLAKQGKTYIFKDAEETN